MQNVDKDRYRVSDMGRVYDTQSKRYLNISIDNNGYRRVHIHTIDGFKSIYLHRLVKIEFDGFDPHPSKIQIDHIDCDKGNNYLENLEWVDSFENTHRAINNNLYTSFDVVLTEEDVEIICQLLKQGKSYREISDLLFDKFGRDLVGIIGKIYRGERWVNISNKYMPFPPLKKDFVIPANSVLTEEIVEDICANLDSGKGIAETARIIQNKYSIKTDLENAIGFIKRGRTWTHISKKYHFMEERNMTKPKVVESLNDFEESIKNYGNKIEHIDSFVEAVRRFPGKY